MTEKEAKTAEKMVKTAGKTAKTVGKTAKEAKTARLLWVDLEMTGLSPVKDRILEVAVIATGWDLVEIANYTGVVKVPEVLMRARMTGEFWKKNAESFRALTAQNARGKSRKTVEQELLAFVERYFDPRETIYLAGNSIHQDRKFIEREWPLLNARLHYRMLDVSAWKVYFEGALGAHFVKPEDHRALSDVRGGIEELKWYLKRVS